MLSNNQSINKSLNQILLNGGNLLCTKLDIPVFISIKKLYINVVKNYIELNLYLG